jgi:hypothetical protein
LVIVYSYHGIYQRTLGFLPMFLWFLQIISLVYHVVNTRDIMVGLGL